MDCNPERISILRLSIFFTCAILIEGELTNREVRLSMESYFRVDRVPELFDNEFFDEETWSNLLRHIRSKCSPFFRLLPDYNGSF